MRITDLQATIVIVLLEAPLLHAHGSHWGSFVRTIVEVETGEGLTELGEMGEEGRGAELTFEGLKPYLIGYDPFELDTLRFIDLQTHHQPLQSYSTPRRRRVRLPGPRWSEVRRPGVRPALGERLRGEVHLDREKLGRYAELCEEPGGYPYDSDPGRPSHYPLLLKQQWADPAKSIEPSLYPER